MSDSRITIMKKLIIIIGIIAAILTFLIPFRAKSLQVVGHLFDLNAAITMTLATREREAGIWQTK